MKCSGFVNDTRGILGVLYVKCENEGDYVVEHENYCSEYCTEHTNYLTSFYNIEYEEELVEMVSKQLKLKNNIDCPTCGEVTTLKSNDDHIFYKDNVHKITFYYYRCEPCDLEFTTTESDTKTMGQLPGYPKE